MDERCRQFLEETALEIRKDVVRMISLARNERLALSLSLVDVLVYLYWKILRVSSETPGEPLRDRFVLSDGLCVPALYAVLAAKGFFSRDELWSFSRLGAVLQGTPFMGRTPGVDAPGGPPGQGLGIAAGMALALRRQLSSQAEEGERNVPGVFCCMNMEELREGFVWDAARMAVENALDGLRVVVNCPGWNGKTEPFRNEEMERLAARFRSLGWKVALGDGHDFGSLEEGFANFLPAFSGALSAGVPGKGARVASPGVFLLRTRFGKGVSAEENRGAASDERPPFSRPRLDSALRELEGWRGEGEDGDSLRRGDGPSEFSVPPEDLSHPSEKGEFL